MNSVPDIDDTDARIELTQLFLRRTRAEVEQMRRNVPHLIEGDVEAWMSLRADAARIHGMAAGLKLDTLSEFARELSDLAERGFPRGNFDTDFLLKLTRAIEMLAIEINELGLRRGR